MNIIRNYNVTVFEMAFAVIVLGFSLLPASTSASQNIQWVYGSWVNLRAEPSTESGVSGKLTANTEVNVLSQDNDWCEVRAESLDVNGYTLCSLLRDRPLTLDEVTDPDSDSYSPLRAFWIAPSVYRLKLAGKFYEDTMLSERQKERESVFRMRLDSSAEWEKRVEPKRPAIREFEAMKELLGNGVVADKEVIKSLSWFNEDRTLKVKFLAPIKPSLFRNANELVAHPVKMETLSAQFGIKEHLRVLNRTRWHRFANSVEMVGTWDMGDLEITLDEPVVEYVIGRTGLASALEWRGPETHYATSEYECGDDSGLVGDHKLRDYPSVKDPLVWFYMKSPLPYRKVTVNVSKLKADEKPIGNESELKDRIKYEIDIDGDGIADLTVLDLKMKWGWSKEIQVVERDVYANIAGDWHAIEHGKYYDECT